MTMDPRVEATLVEFARTKLLPPGYGMQSTGARSMTGDILYTLTCGDWVSHGLSLSDGIAAAWTRSDRRSGGLPTTYCVAFVGDGWCAQLYDPPISSTIFWRSEKVATIEDANEAAWDHYDKAEQIGRDWDISIGCHMGEDVDDVSQSSPGDHILCLPADCRWTDDGDVLVASDGRFRLRLSDTGMVTITDRTEDRIDISVEALRYFLDMSKSAGK